MLFSSKIYSSVIMVQTNVVQIKVIFYVQITDVLTDSWNSSVQMLRKETFRLRLKLDATVGNLFQCRNVSITTKGIECTYCLLVRILRYI